MDAGTATELRRLRAQVERMQRQITDLMKRVAVLEPEPEPEPEPEEYVSPLKAIADDIKAGTFKPKVT